MKGQWHVFVDVRFEAIGFGVMIAGRFDDMLIGSRRVGIGPGQAPPSFVCMDHVI